MKLTEEIKSQIDWWLEDRTPEEVAYILEKYNILNSSIKKDILHVCTWYQGRDVDACERVEKWVEDNL